MAMAESTIIYRRIHFHLMGRRRVLHEGPPEIPAPQSEEGTVPRVARLMALAIRLKNLVGSGEVANYSTLATVGHVSRARITQIVKLTLLAPDIQEAILFLPASKHRAEQITERDLRPLTAEPDWGRQREMWATLASRSGSDQAADNPGRAQGDCVGAVDMWRAPNASGRSSLCGGP
jgi:hypothetical protein